MCVPTTIPHVVEGDEADLESNKPTLLAELRLDHLSEDITISSWTPWTTKKPATVEHNPLRKALREALEALPPGTLGSFNVPHLTVHLLLSTFPESYSIYKPLLLLPSNSISQTWSTLLSEHVELLQPIWQRIAAALQCTHIALNSPIPPSNTPGSAHGNDDSNILRSPVHLTPIYGSFGPPPTLQTLSSPTPSDFGNTLWVRTTQNGIHQTWAPLYTMFSRGNVKEKARILHLPSVTSLATTEQNATAVDMYAGIGYFSFSYRKSGLSRILCWELNPWSVEGLRQGAALNGWSSRIFTPAEVPQESAAEAEWEAWRRGVAGRSEDFWIFQMSNATAQLILQCLRNDVPPIRHVNLGLLPASRLSWPSAVRALDKECGGWIHAHENVGLHEMDKRKVEVGTEFQRLVNEYSESLGDDAKHQKKKVQVGHVERVKMYAPGVVHAVFDVYVPETGTEMDV
ncbi:tRNA(Phe) (4-demethylwyosine(37)-C(7)) aminocarboxypropyltransferase [Ascochyta rabiei]|nr:tRNA(Phe) (4-demethylwyosine(37)-C(7)) aminocarboxypropyltransferase [Ascochyta rabiei]UPX18748.1 tRNA(Phe) (4-demethylwyosine(37)-C(7)) aminocarboxypropyltransferase [Ascochyta rabiei]